MKTASRIKIVLIEGGKVGKFQELPQPGEKALLVKGKNGLKILFVDDEDQYAPENLTLARNGDDLLIFLEGSTIDQPELIVENYYQSQNIMLIGQAENGEYYEFISSDGTHFSMLQDSSQSLPLILGGNPAPLAPGSAMASSSSYGVHDWNKLGWAGLGILGAGALIWGIYEIDHDDSSSHHWYGPLTPDVPKITAIQDDVLPVRGTVADNGYTNDARPTLEGMAKADSIVNVYRNGRLIGSTQAGADGKWSFTPAENLPEGRHTFHVTATVNGSVSENSPNYSINLDVTPPTTPRIQGIQAEDGKHETPSTTPTIYGQAEAGSVVKIYLDNKLLGTVRADQSGNWSYTPRGELILGDYVLNVRAADAAGNESSSSENYALSIVSYTLAITQVTNVQADGFINVSQPEIVGNGTPGQIVQLRNGNTVLGSARVDSEGHWKIVPTNVMPDGTYSLTAVALDSNGQVVQTSGAIPLTVDTEKPQVPAITEVKGSAEGDNPIQSGETVNDLRPLISGTAEAGTVVTLYNGTVVLGSVVADASGNWTFRPATDLAEQAYNLTVRATDSAGNVSDPSTAFGFIVDLISLTEPVILHVRSTENPDLEPIGNDGRIHEARPTFQGTGEPGATVTLHLDQQVVGSATVDASGNWSIVSQIDFNSGAFSVSASSPNSTGSGSEWSVPFSFNVSLTGESFDIDINPGTFFEDPAVAVHGTDGIDTLRLTAADQVLDLNGLTGVDEIDGRITSIEIFDITGAGDNTLILLSDVFGHMGQHDLFATRNSVQLMVKGNEGDQVTFSEEELASWAATTETVQWEGNTYAVYQFDGSDLELLVQQGVTTNLI